MVRASGRRPVLDGDQGMVTVETAISLAAFLCVVAFALAAVVVLLDQLRCTDAAREAARLVARGDRARVSEAVEAIAPDGAGVTVSRHGDAISVSVGMRPVGGVIPGLAVRAAAFAVAEPGATR